MWLRLTALSLWMAAAIPAQNPAAPITIVGEFSSPRSAADPTGGYTVRLTGSYVDNKGQITAPLVGIYLASGTIVNSGSMASLYGTGYAATPGRVQRLRPIRSESRSWAI